MNKSSNNITNRNIDSHIIDAINIISGENNINKEDIIKFIEDAFVAGGKKKYGNSTNIVAECNIKNGAVKLFRILDVVESVEDSHTQIDLASAKKFSTAAEIGKSIKEEIPANFDRTIIEKISKHINYLIGNEKKEKEYQLFKDRVGTLVKGVVKSVLRREIILWLRDGTVEAVMDPREVMFNEKLNVGDEVSAIILDVERNNNRPQVILSRRHESYLVALMKIEIPEIEQELVRIVKIAREAGQRSKVIVMSSDSRLDPVGACIGGRGNRIQAIMKKLNGEKIDIIEYSNNVEVITQRAITPAKPIQIIANDKLKTIDVVVSEDQLSLAIGKRGQNVRLVSKLTGYNIDIMTEAQKKEKSANKFNQAVKNINEALHLDDIVGQMLVAHGFTTIDEISTTHHSRIAAIEGFNEEIAEAIIARSIEAISERKEYQENSIEELKIQNEVLELPILTKEMIIKLGKSGAVSIKDIADLAVDELMDIVGNDQISESDAGDVIMIARRFCYNI